MRGGEFCSTHPFGLVAVLGRCANAVYTAAERRTRTASGSSLPRSIRTRRQEQRHHLDAYHLVDDWLVTEQDLVATA